MILRGAGLQAAVFFFFETSARKLRAFRSKVEDFGLETEPTSANRRNQMKFQVSPAPGCAAPFEKETSVISSYEHRELSDL